jgi:transcriptional regulator with XRE-family HTH domain
MVNRRISTITAAQLRAARGWLKWSQDELAERSGVSKSSIVQFELERSVPYSGTMETLQHTFEAAGIEFLFDGPVAKGIRIL